MGELKIERYAEGTPEWSGPFDLGATGVAWEPSGAERTFADLRDRRLISHPEANPVFVEQYRRLGAALYEARLERQIRSIMITSAVEGEGKTLSAINLALVLSRSFRKRVLLVDGDLRKPSVHQLLQLQNGTGLADILKRPVGRLPAHELSPTLSVITSGQRDADPVALLVSDAARRFMADVRDLFDCVVVDTPPIILFPDAGLFAGSLDACLMVVRAGTPAAQAARAVAALGSSRILGAVLNRAEASEVAAGSGYGRYGYQTRGDRSSPFGWWWRSGRG